MMAVPKEYQYLTRSSSEAGPHAGKNLFLCNAAGDPLDIKSAILFETKVKPEDGLTSKDAFFDHAERSKAFVVNNKEALLREPYPVTTLNQALQIPENRTLEEAFPEKEIFRIDPASTLLYPENENPTYRPTIKRAGIFAEENTSPIACLSSDSMIFRLSNSDLEIVYSPLPTDIQLAKLQEAPGVKIDLREIFNGQDIDQLLTKTFSQNPSYLLVKGDKHYIASADQLKDHHEINAITYPSDMQTVVQVLAHVGLIPKNESLSPPSDKLYAFRIHVSGKHPNTLLSIETDSYSIPLVQHANSKFLIKLGEPDYSIGTHAVDAEEDSTKTLFDKITHSHQSRYFEILRMFAKENIQCTNSISDSSPLLHVPQGESYSTKHAHYYNRSGIFYRTSTDKPYTEGIKIFHGPSLLHTVHANENSFAPLALEIAPNARSHTNWIISKSFLEQNPATGDGNPDTHTSQEAEEKSDSHGSNNTSDNSNKTNATKKDAVDKPYVHTTQKAEEKSDSHGSNNTSDNSNKTNATKKDAVDKPYVHTTQEAEEKSDSHGSNSTSDNSNKTNSTKKDAVDKPYVHTTQEAEEKSDSHGSNSTSDNSNKTNSTKKDAVDEPHVHVTQKAEQESEKFLPGPTTLIFQSPKTDADETYQISSVHSSLRESPYGIIGVPMHGCHFTTDNKLLCGDDFATTLVIPPEYHFLKVIKNINGSYGLTFCNATNQAISPDQLEDISLRPPLLAKLKSLVAADGEHINPSTKNTLGANLDIVNNLLLHPNPPGPAELQQIFHTQKGDKPAFKIVNEDHAAIVSPLNSISSNEKRWLSAGTEYFYKNQDDYYLVQDGALIKKIPIVQEPPSDPVVQYTGFIIVDSKGISLQHSPSSEKDARLVHTYSELEELHGMITNIAHGSSSMHTQVPIMAKVSLQSNLVNTEGPSDIYVILFNNNHTINTPLPGVKFFPEIFTLVYQPRNGSTSVVLATDTDSLLRSAASAPIKVQGSVRTIEKLLALEMQDVEAPTTTTETITPTDDGASGKKPTFVDPDQPKVPGEPTVTKESKGPVEPTVTKETKGTELPTITKESKGPVEPTVTKETKGTELPTITKESKGPVEPTVTKETNLPGEPTVTKESKGPVEPTVTKETKGTELPTVTKESKGPVEPTVTKETNLPGEPTVTKESKGPVEPTVTKETKGTELPTITKESKGPVEPTVTKETNLPGEPTVTKESKGPVEPTVTKETKGTELPTVTKESKGPVEPTVTKETNLPGEPTVTKESKGPVEPTVTKESKGPGVPTVPGTPTEHSLPLHMGEKVYTDPKSGKSLFTAYARIAQISKDGEEYSTYIQLPAPRYLSTSDGILLTHPIFSYVYNLAPHHRFVKIAHDANTYTLKACDQFGNDLQGVMFADTQQRCYSSTKPCSIVHPKRLSFSHFQSDINNTLFDLERTKIGDATDGYEVLSELYRTQASGYAYELKSSNTLSSHVNLVIDKHNVDSETVKLITPHVLFEVDSNLKTLKLLCLSDTGAEDYIQFDFADERNAAKLDAARAKVLEKFPFYIITDGTSLFFSSDKNGAELIEDKQQVRDILTMARLASDDQYITATADKKFYALRVSTIPEHENGIQAIGVRTKDGILAIPIQDIAACSTLGFQRNELFTINHTALLDERSHKQFPLFQYRVLGEFIKNNTELHIEASPYFRVVSPSITGDNKIIKGSTDLINDIIDINPVGTVGNSQKEFMKKVLEHREKVAIDDTVEEYIPYFKKALSNPEPRETISGNAAHELFSTLPVYIGDKIEVPSDYYTIGYSVKSKVNGIDVALPYASYGLINEKDVIIYDTIADSEIALPRDTEYFLKIVRDPASDAHIFKLCNASGETPQNIPSHLLTPEVIVDIPMKNWDLKRMYEETADYVAFKLSPQHTKGSGCVSSINIIPTPDNYLSNSYAPGQPVAHLSPTSTGVFHGIPGTVLTHHSFLNATPVVDIVISNNDAKSSFDARMLTVQTAANMHPLFLVVSGDKIAFTADKNDKNLQFQPAAEYPYSLLMEWLRKVVTFPQNNEFKLMLTLADTPINKHAIPFNITPVDDSAHLVTQDIIQESKLFFDLSDYSICFAGKNNMVLEENLPWMENYILSAIIPMFFKIGLQADIQESQTTYQLSAINKKHIAVEEIGKVIEQHLRSIKAIPELPEPSFLPDYNNTTECFVSEVADTDDKSHSGTVAPAPEGNNTSSSKTPKDTKFDPFHTHSEENEYKYAVADPVQEANRETNEDVAANPVQEANSDDTSSNPPAILTTREERDVQLERQEPNSHANIAYYQPLDPNHPENYPLWINATYDEARKFYTNVNAQYMSGEISYEKAMILYDNIILDACQQENFQVRDGTVSREGSVVTIGDHDFGNIQHLNQMFS
ncbi:hypothetical protein O998_00225 [Anaplasma phagocytophilum str. Norway variant1]|uniref:Uncharacterized protein n=1 Tax=Anaplasma phagocytophilum str. Norway variant1 TaxID=1392506 RepID=A0A7H9DZ94_ANAPH|nr:hypothetical protein [Anaplasma phagocytophilum]QLL66366.1 hypothetical protein O998_00225 [Anaplasma phagocytophilum str. Norway variant1]